MFGGRIFGGGTTRKHHGSGGERRREGETMMCWFMNRWGTISEGLFEVVEERKESGDVQVKTANGSLGTSGQTPQTVSSGDFGSSPSISLSTLNLPFIRPLEIGKVHQPPSASGTSSVNEHHSPSKCMDSMSDGDRFKVGNNRTLSAVENRVTSPPEADAYYFWGGHHAETFDKKPREPNKIQSVFLSPSPASSNDRLDVCSAQDVSSEAASTNSAPGPTSYFHITSPTRPLTSIKSRNVCWTSPCPPKPKTRIRNPHHPHPHHDPPARKPTQYYVKPAHTFFC
ncbi:uncharacterized protein LACBIDRAFT_297964 [Laccaria bicolor S238N-H82]|uniref:Predicted protein n=1 Tax=Laccaria bicolor (strain S238N-H82 / ATCC MYA-4686) TaxID=486041 RepID=B0DBY3_LACBS|nr:uncharacterized protein LACBIDRAFT_297964 [Laccaria bicolor S238N-H82]EDR07798.1 predicted protein [Laccaria bicolor S238N-H82]|eukprot:XP_001881587.1 predicted protein [Laccaria bicolor S238N-H82]